MAASLKLYNTLTREKADFEPIDPTNVRMYVCGPTVYDFAHIGNARPVIVFDVLYRLLRHVYGEEHVTYVRNITDVDDKINARALRDFGGRIADGSMSLNEAIRAVTEKTESQFHKDVAALGTLPPTVEPRATDNIPQMIEIIQRLLDAGHAYVAAGAEGQEVLFSTASMPDYGKLSKRKLEDQQAGARIAVEAHKRNPADFVLWKESAATEPGWAAAFTVAGSAVSIYGRPGWHIECSAMSDRYLWQEARDRLSPKGKAKPHQFDIHGGGLDLIFPHHENEIAQSCCAYNTHVMANVWMHNGFLQVEGRKMSKSEGNFVTINELLETEKFGGRKWPGEVLRLAMLMTHYREPIDFSVKRLEEAENISRGWMSKLSGHDSRWMFSAPDHDALLLAADDLQIGEAIKLLNNKYSGDLSSDRVGALASTLGLMGLMPSRAIQEHFDTATDRRSPPLLAKIQQGIDEMVKRFRDYQANNELSAAVEALVDMRLEMLKAKNFAEADKIRDDLLAKGIQLKDGKDPVTGERVTTWEVKR
ncbi:cysteine--tRNA ligase [Ciceribacter sp. RN22]|uniref:cysteine--tRNA ligase n=1 Tax=Ciceribacter sp. RN22 TaxID=2954932 RepID=UPI002093362E|nr:cysteine--tRNA ligase [Ciceribacter sp. RN22]MCO6177721.1 cysteine--tRNA ligase [Ciceribacter sp. RN22]